MGWVEKTAAGRWRGVYRVGEGRTGRKRSRVFDHKAEAAAWWKREEPKPLTRAAVTLTIAEALEDWLEHAELAPTTRAKYRSVADNHVLPKLAGVRLAELDAATIADHLQALKVAGVGQATRIEAREVLVLTLKRAKDRGHVAVNHARDVSLPKERDELRRRRRDRVRMTSEQVWAIADAIDPRYRAFVLVGGFCGLRFQEAAGLRWSHVDFDAAMLDVCEATTLAGGKLLERQPLKTEASYGYVPLPAFVVDALREHARRYGGGPDELVFRTPQGRPMRTTEFAPHAWRHALEHVEGIEVPAATYRDLRRACGIMAVKAGHAPGAVRELLRHSSIRTTMDIYADAQAEPGELARGIAASFDGLERPKLPANVRRIRSQA